VERILAESGVERTPVPPESSYLGELSRAFWGAVARLIDRAGQALRIDAETLFWIVVAIVAVILALIGRALFLSWRRRRQARRPEIREATSPLDPAAADWDAAAWRAELERCLAEERIGEALRAAWWWLARSIAGPQVQPDWTSRDLLGRTRRRELRDLLRRLDLLTYGADRPGPEDLRQLAEQLRGALG
jgi:hypothetical protein